MNKIGVKVSVLSISLAAVSALFLSSQSSQNSTPERLPAQESPIDPDFNDGQALTQTNFNVSFPASKHWTQQALLERAKELATQTPKIRIDVFRVYEERHNDGALLDRRAVFPEVQFYSPRKESHSAVVGPTPVEFMAVWVNDSLEFTFAVSSATYRKRFVPARDQWEHPETPHGEWSPIYVTPLHHSNTFKPVGADIGPEMPFAIFIDNAANDLLKGSSGYAFHGTTLSHYEALGTPDSGGCVRLSREDAEILFALVNPAMTTINRFGKWYGQNDRRNIAHPFLVSLRERMKINIIDPAYMDAHPDFAQEIHSRYDSLLQYLLVSVNSNLQRTKETLRSGHHRTLTEITETSNVATIVKTKPNSQ